MKIPDLADPQYRQRLSAGDPQVLEEVFEYYTLYVANRACNKGSSRDAAEDIAQETVLAVYKAIRAALKKGSQLTFDSRDAFEGYLMTSAFSKIHKYGKQTEDQDKFEVPLDEGDDDTVLGEERAGGASPASSESRDVMETIQSNPRYRDAFNRLKKEYQDVIAETLGKFSKLYPGATYDAQHMIEQYARSTGETISTMRRRYYRALKKLEQNYRDLKKSKQPGESDKISA